MELNEALRIVEVLADGVDPRTGEILPEDSPLQDSHVIRALHAVLRRLSTVPASRSRKLPARAGQKWTTEESKKLLDGFDEGTNIEQLAERHDRTQGAIRSRLEKLARLKSEDTADDITTP